MTADNIPFLSPSISEKETGWFFAINDNKPRLALLYIRVFHPSIPKLA